MKFSETQLPQHPEIEKACLFLENSIQTSSCDYFQSQRIEETKGRLIRTSQFVASHVSDPHLIAASILLSVLQHQKSLKPEEEALNTEDLFFQLDLFDDLTANYLNAARCFLRGERKTPYSSDEETGAKALLLSREAKRTSDLSASWEYVMDPKASKASLGPEYYRTCKALADGISGTYPTLAQAFESNYKALVEKMNSDLPPSETALGGNQGFRPPAFFNPG